MQPELGVIDFIAPNGWFGTICDCIRFTPQGPKSEKHWKTVEPHKVQFQQISHEWKRSWGLLYRKFSSKSIVHSLLYLYFSIKFDWTLRIMGKDPISENPAGGCRPPLTAACCCHVCYVCQFLIFMASQLTDPGLSAWAADFWMLTPWKIEICLLRTFWRRVYDGKWWMMFMIFPLSNLKMMLTFWEGFWRTLSYCINA